MEMPSGVVSLSSQVGCGHRGKEYLVVSTPTASMEADCCIWNDSCSIALSIPPK